MGKRTIPRSCQNCGTAFRAAPYELRKGYGRYCSHACHEAHQVRLHPPTTKYRYVKRVGHPLANANGRIGEHRLVLFERIGPGAHPCHWCDRPLMWATGRRGGNAIVPDHIDGNGRNNDPANLVPACMSCNTNRVRPTGILAPSDRIGRRRGIAGTCERCGAPFLGRAGQRFCSHGCHQRSA